MKKLLSRITLLLLSLAMVFSLAACGDKDDGGKVNQPKPIVTSQLLNDSATAMLNKSKLKFGGEVSVNFNTQAIKGIDLDVEVVLNKTADGYNSKATAKSGQAVISQEIQIGDVNYSYNPEDEIWNTYFTEEPVDASQVTSQLSQITELFKDVPNKQENGIYTISVKEDYAPVLKQIATEVTANKDKTVADYVAGKLGGASYTGAQLKADINKILADDATVKTAAANIDAMLKNMGVEGVTVKTVVNQAAAQQGLTAQSLYEAMGKPAGAAPNANETVYDYAIRVMGDMPLADLIAAMQPSEPSPEQPYAEQETNVMAGLREMIAEYADATVGVLWDEIIAPMADEALVGDEYNTGYLTMLGVSDTNIDAITAGGTKAVLCVENLSKFNFKTLSIDVKVEFNSDKTVKSVTASAAAAVDYNGASTIQIVNVAASAAVTFTYDNVETVAEPDGLVKPNARHIVIKDGAAAAFEVEVYVGKGYTVDEDWNFYIYDPNESESVSRTVKLANGKISLTADDYAAIRTALQNGGNASLYGRYRKTGDATDEDSISVYFDLER